MIPIATGSASDQLTIAPGPARPAERSLTFGWPAVATVLIAVGRAISESGATEAAWAARLTSDADGPTHRRTYGRWSVVGASGHHRQVSTVNPIRLKPGGVVADLVATARQFGRPFEAARWARGPSAIAVLALAYFLLGRLALLLAIPPGYATAFWPPAGIAFAGLLLLGIRAWPGIVIGSFLVNVWTGFDASTPHDLIRSIGVPAAIGFGAAGQAALGVWLVRRLIRVPVRLTEAREVVRFLAAAGPLSCVIGASVGVTTLAMSGAVAWQHYVANWATWWVGDTIGALVVAPLVVLWTPLSRAGTSRRLLVSLPLGLAFGAVVLLYVQVSSAEQTRITDELGRRSRIVSRAIEADVDAGVEALYAIRGLYGSSVEVDPDEFGSFTSLLLDRHPSIQALAFDRLISDAARPTFEAEMGRQVPGLRITERDAAGELVPAGRRKEYVVVTHVQPITPNSQALGFDVASEPLRLQALNEARDTGGAVATGQIALVQNAPGLLIVLPIYKDGTPPDAVPDRRSALVGYAIGVYRIDRLVGGAIARADQNDMVVRVTDTTDAARSILYDTAGSDPPGTGNSIQLALSTLSVAGRSWLVELMPGSTNPAALESWQPWLVLVAGLLVVALLGAFLLIATGRADAIANAIANLVAQRTAELSAANAALEREVTTRLAIAAELERSNRDLGEFASVAAHDLQEPLRKIQAFGDRLDARATAALDAEGRDYLDRMRGAASRMQALIGALLTYSRVATQRELTRDLELGAAALNALGDLESRVEETGATIDLDELPTVEADPYQMQQLFQNLVGNALKFRRDGVMPSIIIQAVRTDDGDVAFEVRDNGIGFDPAYAERIFGPFQRLHGRSQYEGTGMGLAICRRIVERHGGTISVASQPGHGTTFTIRLPRRQPRMEAV